MIYHFLHISWAKKSSVSHSQMLARGQRHKNSHTLLVDVTGEPLGAMRQGWTCVSVPPLQISTLCLAQWEKRLYGKRLFLVFTDAVERMEAAKPGFPNWVPPWGAPWTTETTARVVHLWVCVFLPGEGLYPTCLGCTFSTPPGCFLRAQTSVTTKTDVTSGQIQYQF